MVLLIMSFLRTLRDGNYRIKENQAGDISLKARVYSRFTFPCINLGVHIISEQIPGFSEFAVYHITWMPKVIKPSEILNYRWSLKNINFNSWFFLTSLILVSFWLLFSSKHIKLYQFYGDWVLLLTMKPWMRAIISYIFPILHWFYLL